MFKGSKVSYYFIYHIMCRCVCVCLYSYTFSVFNHFLFLIQTYRKAYVLYINMYTVVDKATFHMKS